MDLRNLTPVFLVQTGVHFHHDINNQHGKQWILHLPKMPAPWSSDPVSMLFHSKRDIANEISLDQVGLPIELQKSFIGKTFLNYSKEDEPKKGQTD